jgi:hypothetical protein
MIERTGVLRGEGEEVGWGDDTSEFARNWSCGGTPALTPCAARAFYPAMQQMRNDND